MRRIRSRMRPMPYVRTDDRVRLYYEEAGPTEPGRGSGRWM